MKPEAIWRCPECGFLTAESADSSECPMCHAENATADGDTWQIFPAQALLDSIQTERDEARAALRRIRDGDHRPRKTGALSSLEAVLEIARQALEGSE